MSAERHVRIPSGRDLSALTSKPITVIDYGSFRWTTWRDGDSPGLSELGIGALEAPDYHRISVPGFRFDPLVDGEPDLPAGTAETTTTCALRLVQFHGPTKDLWYREVVSSGASILQYYPHNSYLIWCDGPTASLLRGLPFVRWVGPFQPAYKLSQTLRERSGILEYAVALVLDNGDLEATSAAFVALGAEDVRVSKVQADGLLKALRARVDSSCLADLAGLANVVWIGYQSPQPVVEDEMSDQIVAGNHPAGVPATGYSEHLATLGVDGAGVIWAVSDTGVDWDHPDLSSHIVGGLTPPGAGCDVPGQPGSDCAGGGHGTHVAGILAGDAAAGFTDGSGFLYGLGMAPETGVFALNVFSSITLENMTKEALLGGAIGSNNSWATSSGSEGAGYTLAARTEDILVRDGNLDTADVAEPFIQVFSAGNSGPSASTITEPKEAKNLISVANSLNARAGDIDLIDATSSRGPAIDGRILPVVAAPGATISSTRNDLGGQCASSIADTQDLYAFCSGTSMAAPHVSGAIVLATQWWRARNGGADPSMAMAKALMINSAVDMGMPDIPNTTEGWGRVNISNVIDPGVPVAYFDQTEVVADTGSRWTVVCERRHAESPLKVSLVYSDAPGAADANPALVNDLDLEVEHAGQVYLGNVFSSGWSTTGGTPDVLNNVENVYLQATTTGSVRVTISAANIAGDGVPYNGDPTDQDFALICWNCVPALFADGFESGSTSGWTQP